MMVGFLGDTAVEGAPAAESLAGSRSSCTLPCHYNCCTIGLDHTALEGQPAPGPAGNSSPPDRSC